MEEHPIRKRKGSGRPLGLRPGQDLIPSDHGYFTFSGSLTTPPCTEGVTWYVLKSHATVSPQQIDAFAKIYPKNARPIQPTNGRDILESK